MDGLLSKHINERWENEQGFQAENLSLEHSWREHFQGEWIELEKRIAKWYVRKKK